MTAKSSEKYRQCLPHARGEAPSDLLIRNARVANVFSLEYEQVDVAVANGIVVGMGGGYEAVETFDACGMVLIPGLIDGHTHIESTMLTPARFAECVVPHGTSAVMADPHEIANVMGKDGIVAMWKNAQGLAMDFFWGASSCVPASDFETCREALQAEDLSSLIESGICGYLGEMMNYPAVIRGDAGVWAKIEVAWGRALNAHSPKVSGRDLCAYLLSGCDADHESVSYEESLEKLRRGGWVMMRAGTAANDLPELARLVAENPARASRIMVVSDDLTASALWREGHLDTRLRAACALGIDPLIALRMLTLSPAEYFRLPRRGGIAPGWAADLVLVDSVESCKVSRVWKDGRLVAADGLLCGEMKPSFEQWHENRASRGAREKKSTAAIVVPAPAGDEKIRVIGRHENSLLTDSLCMTPTIAEGRVVADPERDIAKLVVQGRSRGQGPACVGFVKGLGLKRGALGSSVAHDAHPYVVAGADDRSIRAVLDWLKENGGGLAVFDGERIIASLPLPVAGLMSDSHAKDVAEKLDQVNQAAARIGIGGKEPSMSLSFLSLSVIPALKLTDRGYVDFGQGGAQELFAASCGPNVLESLK